MTNIFQIRNVWKYKKDVKNRSISNGKLQSIEI